MPLAHRAISASRAKPLSPRSRMRTRGHMLLIGVLWLTMDRLLFMPFERAT